jgi:hypothetical protein
VTDIEHMHPVVHLEGARGMHKVSLR